MYNHNKAQQSKNRVHISCDILYIREVQEQSHVPCVIEITLPDNWHNWLVPNLIKTQQSMYM